jgi:hypothetical protein
MFGGTWTDITSYVRQGTITRPGSRLQGPVWQYQAGTASLTLKNTDGRFDPDNLSGPYVVTNPSRVLTIQSGASSWIPPAGAAATAKVECWGSGASGGVGFKGGGGGAEYAAEPAMAISAGVAVAYSVGAAAAGGTTDGSNGSATTCGTVTAHGGSRTTTTAGGAGGTGSSNTTHFDGGAGGTMTGLLTQSGGGGGGSGGTASAGNAAVHTTGAVAVTGGGPGGNGGLANFNGSSPTTGPGGGGGCGGVGAMHGGASASGQVRITYVLSGTFTQVLPMVPVQIQATWSGTTYTLFTGYADSWSDQGDNYAGNYDEVILTATDAFKVLAGKTLATLGSSVGAAEDSGARVNRILDAAGWSSTARNVTTGDTTLQATSFGDTALNLLQLTADSELGELYVDGPGNLTFRHRLGLLQDTRSNTPQAVFGDSPGTVETAGTEIKYLKVSRASDDTTLINDCQITPANGGTLQEAINADSEAKYLYPRTYSRSDLLMQDNTTGLNYAQWIVYLGADAEDRFDVLTVVPGRDPTNLFPQVLGRELGDRIQIWRRPPNAGTVTKDVFIRQITHTFSALWWQTDWMLSSASKYGSFLTLDNTTLGKLNQNALAY